ncbi:MAG: hypothetical protein IPM29_07895 [Planctomycetes bacterium]|nr:hypothetical protein [Planctomycetota bacterium]
MKAARRLLERRDTGPKHDLWVVPYADMMTLLFAIFVVLYSIGETRIQKLEELRQAIAFHLSLGGGVSEGTMPSAGASESYGDLTDGVQLINAQPAEMKRFVSETLPDSFLEAAGKSLEILLTDDTIEFVADLDSFYEPGEVAPRRQVQDWLLRMFEGMWGNVSEVRIIVEAPDNVIGRDATGQAVRTDALSEQRLQRLRTMLRRLPVVDTQAVVSEFRSLPQTSRANWQLDGRIHFAFADP